MKFFTLTELCFSAKAQQFKITNQPNQEQRTSLEVMVEQVLDPIRELWAEPIVVSSGFRSVELNALVGGAKNSQHTKGQAADISVGSALDNRRLFELIVGSGLEFDQLIDEKNFSWLHISYVEFKNRGQILHL